MNQKRQLNNFLRYFYSNLRIGSIVAGNIYSSESNGLLVSFQNHILFYLPINQFYYVRKELKPGKTLEFIIIGYKRNSKFFLISLNYLDYIRNWQRIKQLEAENQIVLGKPFKYIRKGLLVRIENILGIIPNFQIPKFVKKNKLLNNQIPLKLITVDYHNRKIVLSYKKALIEKFKNENLNKKYIIGKIQEIKIYGLIILVNNSVSGWLYYPIHNRDSNTILKINQEIKISIAYINVDKCLIIFRKFNQTF
uniref:Ribosomal protein S1-like protein n=1 Tax=Cyanidium sp. THAL103 TaxID=3027999 RepID=A0A9Y1MYB4_9RHOD|nr:ribosomal protein S1-like protein [Cyanidium sp. THAL103]